jgi:hypothetical protein
VRKLFVLLAALGLAAVAQAQQAGVVTHLSGILSVKRGEAPAKILSVKSEVKEGDLLTTEAETYARIKFADNSEVVLRPGTQLKIESYAFNQAQPDSDNVLLSMLKGGLRAVTGLIGKRNHDKVNFSTATATIGIRGTHFGALLCQNDCGGVPTTSGHAPPNGLHLDVADGAILVRNGAGQIQLNAGQFGFVANPNTPPVTVPPAQGIQVTMPSSISQNKGTGHGIGKGGQGECAL